MVCHFSPFLYQLCHTLMIRGTQWNKKYLETKIESCSFMINQSFKKKWTGTINLTIVWTTYYCSLKSFLEPWCCHKWFPWEYIHFKLLNCILAFEIKFGSQGWSLYSGAYSFSHLLPALIHDLYLHIILLAIIICALNLCTSRLEIHGFSVSVYYLCMKT